MQVEDGDIVPEKELDKSYKIPKRKADEMEGQETVSGGIQQTATCSLNAINPQTPLASSYYNYNMYNMGTWQNPQQYYEQYQQYTTGQQGSVDPVTQNIFKALSSIKEKPKTYKSNIFASTNPDISDDSLPKDLKALFQPLFCKLCSAQLSSNINAKLHYSSKNHEKKIKKWLIEYSQTTGEPLHKRAKTSNNSSKQVDESDKNPKWFHCDVCDLPLTGKLHAESHYMGKNHQKAVMGYKNPAGLGYYNEEGKWVRTKSTKSKSYNFENGEDSFGASFKKDKEPEEDATLIGPKIPVKQQGKFHCDVCNISTTCQEQLDSHYRGGKHQKKLKHLGLSKYTDQREMVDTHVVGVVPPPSLLDTSGLSQINGSGDINLAVYRTPSGDFYCPTCNSTCNSESQFLQHMKSKQHMKKCHKK